MTSVTPSPTNERKLKDTYTRSRLCRESIGESHYSVLCPIHNNKAVTLLHNCDNFDRMFSVTHDTHQKSCRPDEVTPLAYVKPTCTSRRSSGESMSWNAVQTPSAAPFPVTVSPSTQTPFVSTCRKDSISRSFLCRLKSGESYCSALSCTDFDDVIDFLDAFDDIGLHPPFRTSRNSSCRDEEILALSYVCEATLRKSTKLS